MRSLALAALNERASPKQVAVSVGAGCFVGLTPAVGFHMGLAVAVATVLRVNRLWCVVGSRISNPLTGPPIVFAQIQLAHRLRTGAWLSLNVDSLLAQAPGLLLDWFVGLATFGTLVSIVMGLVAYGWAVRRKNRSISSGPAG